MTRQEAKTRETTRQGINHLAGQNIVQTAVIAHGNDMKSGTSKLAIVGIQLLILLLGFAAKGVALASFGG